MDQDGIVTLVKDHIDTLQVAELLGCHPASVPRFKRQIKFRGKNWWKRSELSAYIRKQFEREGVI